MERGISGVGLIEGVSVMVGVNVIVGVKVIVGVIVTVGVSVIVGLGGKIKYIAGSAYWLKKIAAPAKINERINSRMDFICNCRRFRKKGIFFAEFIFLNIKRTLAKIPTIAKKKAVCTAVLISSSNIC